MSWLHEIKQAGVPEPERARRASGGSGTGVSANPPNPEVSEKPKRRRFTAEYKLRILREADRYKHSREIGALLRREGLYSSQLSTWRRQREEVAQAALSVKKRGRKAKPVDPRMKQLQRENRRLQRKLRQAEFIIEFQKKISEELGILQSSPEKDESD